MSEIKKQQDPVDCWNLGVHLEATLVEATRGLEKNLKDTTKNDPVKKQLKEPVIDRDHFTISLKPARERRKWKRFAIDGAVVMVSKPSFLPNLKPAYIKLGPVKDIGMKGLAVHYVKKNEQALKKSNRLSIVLPQGTTIVDRVPFKIVNKFMVAELPGGKEVWNLCISFGQLLPMQRIQIESFINDYGIKLGNDWAQKTSSSGS